MAATEAATDKENSCDVSAGGNAAKPTGLRSPTPTSKFAGTKKKVGSAASDARPAAVKKAGVASVGGRSTRTSTRTTRLRSGSASSGKPALTPRETTPGAGRATARASKRGRDTDASAPGSTSSTGGGASGRATPAAKRGRARASARAHAAAASSGSVDGEDGDDLDNFESVADIANEAFATDTDFDAMCVIRLPKNAYSHKDKLEKLKPHITKLKAGVRELVAAKDAFLAKADNIDTSLRLKMRNTFAELARLRTENADLSSASKELHVQVAGLQAACDSLTARKEELERERPVLAAEKAAVAKELEETKAELDTARREISTYETRVSSLEEQLEARSAELTKVREEADKAAQAAHEELSAARAASSGEVERIKAEADAATKEVVGREQEARQRAEAAEADAKRLSDELTAARHAVEMVEVAKSAIEREKASADSTVERLTGELSDVRSRLTSAEANMSQTLATLQQAHSAQGAREERLESDRKELQVRVRELQDEKEKLTATEHRLSGELRDEQRKCSSLEESVAEITAKLETTKAELEACTERATAAETELTACREKLATTEEAAEKTRADLEEKLQDALSDVAVRTAAAEEHAKAEAAWAETKTALEKARDDVSMERDSLVEKTAGLENELATLRANVNESGQAQLGKLVEMSKEANSLRRKVSDMDVLQKRLEEAEAEVEALREKCYDGEVTRRQLHNTIQELRGNIRVFARVRPLMGPEVEASQAGVAAEGDDADGGASAGAGSGDEVPIAATKVATKVSADGTGLTLNYERIKGAKPQRFTFDRVFGGKSTQQDLFDEVSPLVQSALDGYHVCLFSYGQTGSGKTFTMQGGSGEHAGLIPRSVSKILEETQRANTRGWAYTLEASFLEIYNEQLRDLLKAGSASGQGGPVSIRLDASGAPDVFGLTKVPVASQETIDKLLARADRNRAVAATEMNERSSRSHSVFILRIKGVNKERGVSLSGALNLCDLAGSERLSRSKAEGARLKETQAINKSLSCLSDVFQALARKSSHVPFRNSKLTFLLQRCFTGDGKTLMLVNLSPTVLSAHESLCSLRFASHVGGIELGKTTRRVFSTEEGEGDAPDGAAESGAASGGAGGAPESSIPKASTTGRVARRPRTASGTTGRSSGGSARATKRPGTSGSAGARGASRAAKKGRTGWQ